MRAIVSWDVLVMARCRGRIPTGDAEVIHMTSAVSYRASTLFVAVFRRRRLPILGHCARNYLRGEICLGFPSDALARLYSFHWPWRIDY